jgi:ATP-dependent 26S proteasome regulatory subunit
VLGLVGDAVGLAADALRQARVRLAERAIAVRARALASLAAGMALPFVEVARDFALSPHATQLLFCAVAPRLRAEVARLYGVLGGLAGRGACDTFLAERLVAETAADRDQLAHELAADAPLVRSGLVRLEPEADRVVLAVDEVLLDRLRGHARAVEISTATVRRDADRALAEVRTSAAVVRDLVLALADHDPARPARVVVRGRRGAGRHTIVAALAAQAGRSIAAIDTARLPRAGAPLATALRTELTRAVIARAIPVVSGLENIDASDGETRHLVRQVMAGHRGPLFVRATPEGDVPVDPDHVAVTLPPLSIGARADAWADALARRGLADADADATATIDPTALALRFRFGVGTIERVCDDVARRARAGAAPAVTAAIHEVARQHIAVRLGRVASRVERLPDWNQVTLLDDMRDSVRELIGRAHHQRTVFEDWGYDRRIATARGLTALFYGPPGTGKTLVAGLIARELGLELWRIDLARVMSKWLGETEKNLAEVFDAAEEGQVMLLFDEADSLFAKRTEVKSSNDRYANLEVNYLLQRLDSFEGVAVLTTNLEGSVDSAFKRRLSMRLYFPFPDEDLRAELWAAHVPPEVPCAGALDFANLARRFPLSGGYIRNSALRAAFLAAQERRPLAQDHLVRAVQLEYRELGKIATTGRLD